MIIQLVYGTIALKFTSIFLKSHTLNSLLRTMFTNLEYGTIAMIIQLE